MPRRHSPSRRHDGLGLGLAIVKQFTELQGGLVSASSDGQGRGAIFVLALPRGSAEPATVATPSAADAATSIPSQFDLTGVSVLVLDDQQDALLVAMMADALASGSSTTIDAVAARRYVLRSRDFPP